MEPEIDPTLWAYLTGALDPSRSSELEDELLTNQALKAQLASITAQLAKKEDPSPRDPWRIPPPGVSTLRGFSVLERRSELLGEELRAGDPFELLIPPVAEPERRSIAVLYRGPEAPWRVLFPRSADDLLTLAELPVEDGSRRIDLVAQPEPGIQRWAVALPDRDLPVAWADTEETRWEALLRAVERGELPVASVDVVVSAP
jgi:hypothetical protein